MCRRTNVGVLQCKTCREFGILGDWLEPSPECYYFCKHRLSLKFLLTCSNRVPFNITFTYLIQISSVTIVTTSPVLCLTISDITFSLSADTRWISIQPTPKVAKVSPIFPWFKPRFCTQSGHILALRRNILAPHSPDFSSQSRKLYSANSLPSHSPKRGDRRIEKCLWWSIPGRE